MNYTLTLESSALCDTCLFCSLEADQIQSSENEERSRAVCAGPAVPPQLRLWAGETNQSV